jgi:APA family basic amino acid/polyamine antiporter
MGGIIGVGIFFNPHKIAERVPVPGCTSRCGCSAAGGDRGRLHLRRAGQALPARRRLVRVPARGLRALRGVPVRVGRAVRAVDRRDRVDREVLRDALHVLAPERVGGTGLASETVAAAVLVCARHAVALTGVKRAALVQNACMITKLFVIAALMIGGLVFASSEVAPVPPATEAAPSFSWSGLTLALLPLFYTLGGWQLLGYIAPEIRDPARTLPRAILWGVAGVVLVYLTVNASYLSVLGIDGLARDADFARTLSQRAFGPLGEKVLAAACASRPSASAP